MPDNAGFNDNDENHQHTPPHNNNNNNNNNSDAEDPSSPSHQSNGLQNSAANHKANNLVTFFKRKLSGVTQLSSQLHLHHQGRKVVVDRPVYSLHHFEDHYGCEENNTVSLSERVKEKVRKNFYCNRERLLGIFYTFFPIFQWLPKYEWKRYFVSDLLAGITVGVMSVPQGMAFARLARVSPIHGLYINFIPTLIYAIIGTSRHASIGGEATSSLLMGTMIDKHLPLPGNNDTVVSEPVDYTALDIAVSAAMLEGLFLLMMGVLRLGFVSVYLSDQLVGGFTTGIAVHVFTSQFPALFGLTVSGHHGPGQLIATYVEFFSIIHRTNWATFVGSTVCIVFLLVVKLLIDPIVKQKLRVPLPSELVVVIVGTVVSYYADLQKTYKLRVVGNIPAGFPTPVIPRFDLMQKLVIDVLILAIVAYSLSVSLCKLYAKKHNYKINPYQEFFAYGGMNCIGAVFQSWPAGNSLSRILVYEGAGGTSQLAAIIGTLIVVITILFIAPYLEQLPVFCLASMIVVACFFMLRQLKDLKPLWKTCKIEFSIYLVTFLAVVLIDVTYGLAVSILYAFFTVIYRTQCPTVQELGTVEHSDIYGEVTKYNKVHVIPGIRVFHFTAPLYYANVEHFRPKLYKRCGIDIERYKQKQQSAAAGKNASPDKKNNSETTAMPEIELHHIVIDCSGFSYVDLMGVNVMKQVYNEMHELGITVFFANCNPSVRRILFKANFFDVVPKEYVFVTLHDAVLAALKLDRIHSSRSLVEMERLVNAITESSVDDTVKL
ncbi:Prestin [Trichinella sp. T8]|nr:Prestin [Trichinella sp. T8]